MLSNAPALEKGLRILEYVLSVNEAVTMSRIAESVGFKVSEIQRMVEYLTKDGFLVKSASGGYAPGARAYGLADRKLDSAVIARAEGPMRRYAARSGASAHLGVLVGEGLHVVYEVEGTGDVRVGVRPGLYVAEQTPSGRLLRAYRGPSTGGESSADLAEIRRAGFAFGELGCAVGVFVLAVPVAIGADPCVAALASPYVLATKDEPPVRQALLEDLRRASAEISALF
ncbi:MAG: helix-turn-helix domain-containing protein [Spirochaetes bacterium]|nr:helix-turn-helix domain-containing protein [Spirochaetota bacterium]MBU1080822.1 helix-turn-helix domain-containing protein [Spirochaetota bacterium]